MIIDLRHWKRLVIIAAVIIIPVIIIIALNQAVESRNKPVIQMKTQKADLEMAINQDLHQRLTEKAQEEANYFADYRIKRDQVRGERMALLREIASNPAAETRARDAAELKIIDLSERIEKEIQAETMVKSCGISECAVIIEEDAVSVIIDQAMDQKKEQEMISAVSRATGKKIGNIHVTIHESAK